MCDKNEPSASQVRSFPASLGPHAFLVFGAALIALYSVLVFDGATAWLSCGLGWAMWAITLEDARRFIIPDVLSLPAIPAGLLATGWLWGFQGAEIVVLEHALAAIVAGFGLWLLRAVYARLRGFEGLGLGDVKLAAVAGAWLGLQHVWTAVLLACLGAFLVLGALKLFNRSGLSPTTAIPFGAFLAPAIWLTWCMLQIPGSAP